MRGGGAIVFFPLFRLRLGPLRLAAVIIVVVVVVVRGSWWRWWACGSCWCALCLRWPLSLFQLLWGLRFGTGTGTIALVVGRVLFMFTMIDRTNIDQSIIQFD